ncbi:TF2B-like protein [Mya arenaria]|uniref:General transcription factor TFIIB n=1 Tax=Mya arenaria TaxID=6604 RepID=A0ABY7GA40_MYAAR|nr:TF2B-like protein [Mya arenaria]
MASTSKGPRAAVLSCPEHPDTPLVEDYHAGDMICPECGLVVGDRVVDVGTEWRTFSNEKSDKDPSRVGASENPLLEGGDLSTMIAFDPKTTQQMDENGKPMYKNRRTMNSSDRALLNAFREISQMGDRLNLPKMVADRGNTLFKQVNDTKSLKGRSNDAICSACMYIACRQEGVPRTFKEICAVSKVSKKEIGRVFKLILKALETNARFCSNLTLSSKIQKAATCIARKAVDLYLSQSKIGDIAGVAEVTIRQAYKLMYPHAHKLFPEDFKFHTPIDQLPAQ